MQACASFNSYSERTKGSLRLLIKAYCNVLIEEFKFLASQALILANVLSCHKLIIIWKSVPPDIMHMRAKFSPTFLRNIEKLARTWV